jgi:hypothetical protein
MFFRRSDGAIFGEGRFQAGFPNFQAPENEDQHWWVLPVQDLLKGMQILKSSAKKDDRSLTFSRPIADGSILMSMLATTGKVTKKEIPCLESGSKEDLVPFTGEFDVDFDSVETVLKASGNAEKIRFGVNRRKKGGYFRFTCTSSKSDTDPGDEYLVFVRWTRA